MERIRKTVVASAIAALLIVSSIFLLIPHSGQKMLSSAPTIDNNVTGNNSQNYYGYSFPFVYKEPSVPSSIGVQGASGPNVPLGQLGVQQSTGPLGHLGPSSQSNPISMSASSARVSLMVYDGTLNPLSRSIDSGATVTFQNISLYKFYTVTTTQYGWGNLTLPEGWYYLTIKHPGTSYIDFSQLIHVDSQTLSIVRYRMPPGQAAVGPVNNGPSSTLRSGSLYVYSASGFPVSQVTVGVYNGSLGGNLIMSEVTNYYGFANYSGLSSSYSYYYKVFGNSQSATGTATDFGNATGAFAAGSDINVALNGKTHWTAAVSGQPPSQGYVNSIQLSSGVTYSGGSVYLSAPFSSNSYWVHFVDTVVYFNSSVTYRNSPNLYFDNSTVIMLSNVNPFGVLGSTVNKVDFNNTIVFFSTLNNTAIPYTASNSVVGPWLVSSSYNSIFVSVHVAYSNAATLAGRYVNSEFYRFNMSAQNPPNTNPVGTANFVRAQLVNSNLAIASLYVDNSLLSGFGYVNIGYSIVINQSYVNYTQWTGEASLGLSKLILYHDTISTLMNQAGALVAPGFLNMSYCLVNETPLTPSRAGGSLTFSPVHAYYYNDYFNDYPNISSRMQMIQSETGSYQQWRGITFGGPFMDMNYTMIHGTDSIGIFPPHYFQYNWSHVNFSAGWGDNEWEPFEWFAGVVTPLIPRGTFNNCSFYGYNYNSTIWWKQYNTSNEDGLGYFQNQNVPTPPSTMWGQIFINYSTAWNTGVGTGGAYAFGLAEGGIYEYLNNNLFLNDYNLINASPVGVNGWLNGSYMQYPIGTQIKHSSGNMTLNNNYFLNLNNKTVPFESISGSDGQGVNGAISMNTGNHFYYMPTVIQSYLPTSTTPPKVPFNNNPSTFWLFPVNSYNRRLNPMYANYTFEIPIASGSPFYAPRYSQQYVFNSSVAQLDIFGPSSTPNTYAWIVEPDINTITHRPVVSFSNGFVGGMMPNFSWNGSSYQLAVEPNMTFIAAQSHSASSVGLQFEVPVGLGALDVWMYNSTSGHVELVKSVHETGTVGTVTVTYDPSTMPLGAVFFTNSSSSYRVTFSESGLSSGTSWSVTLDGVRSVADTNSIQFEAPNGSYSYSVASVAGYTGYPVSGTITVDGASKTVNIQWNRTGYEVQFAETGLSGVEWSVTVGNQTLVTNGSTVDFTEPNGTYAFTVTPPANYTTNLTQGNFTIDGTGLLMNITFSPLQSNTTGTTPPGQQPPPGNPPPTSGNPPPAGGQPTNGVASGYKLLVVQLLAIGLAPSVILSIYMGIYILRREAVLPTKKSDYSKRTVVKKVKRFQKKLK